MPLQTQQPGKGYSANNRARLVKGGKEYFDLLLQLIGQATDTIHLQTYIFDDDKTGYAVANALKEAAQRQVKVYLLADGYASQVMAQSFIDGLREARISFRFFQPLLKGKSFYFGRRLHHKVLVTDNRYALVGGVNITDRYNDMPDQPAWLDFAVYAEGEIAKELCVLCWKTWNNFPLKMGITPCEIDPPGFNFPSQQACEIRMRRNDWVRRKNQISRSYIEMFRYSRSHITILCSYFLPGRVIYRNLVAAAKRGVKVKVILAHFSDVMIAKQAERYMYRRLLRNGIEIYEYKKAVLHGKVAVCDSQWVTIGSYNVNNLSAYASIELNLDVRNAAFATNTEQVLEQIISDECEQVTEEDFVRKSNWLKQLVRWFSFQFIKASVFLFTFYFRKHQ